MLIAQIRDEAHRFAISGMRAQRAKPRTRSSLEDIPGIGKKRRQLLITRLGGIAGVRAADVKQLQAAADLSPKLAQLVYDQLHAD